MRIRPIAVFLSCLLLVSCDRQRSKGDVVIEGDEPNPVTVEAPAHTPPPLQMAGSAPPAPYKADRQASFQPRPALPDGVGAQTRLTWAGLPAGVPVRTVRVYYSDPLPSASAYRDGGQFHAILLSNLIGQYLNVRVIREPISRYRAGEASKSWRTFYVGTVYGEKLPAAFLDEVQAGAPVTWLGYNLWKMGSRLNTLGLQYEVLHTAKTPAQIAKAFSKVNYKGFDYQKYPAPQEMNEVWADPRRTQTLATAFNTAGRRIPYLVRSGRFFYIADNPFQYITTTDRYLVMADSLKTMLGDTRTASCRKQALLRFEDINAMDDPLGLRRALNVVQDMKIPFAFTVIPDSYYRAEHYPWQGNPGMLQQVYRASDLGGVIVQHGYTHNYRGMQRPEGNTGDEWEFWDKQNNRPVRTLTPEVATQRMEAGRKILLDLGINPRLWTTPHYEADVALYPAMQREYPVVLERRMYTADHQRGGQFFPYPVRDIYGTAVLPENLGNVQTNFLPPAVLASADANKNLDCAYASVFIHPYLLLDGYNGSDKLTEASLKSLLEGIQARGFTFVSPLDIRPRVLE